MCGIFAWAGKTPKQFNKTKLDILGIFNEKRGVHSCGIAKDGEIIIGIDQNKIYKDFLANVNYTPPKTIPTVIGHTRQSTFGAHTVENAHPFGFGEFNGGYEFIGVHNGTLVNHTELAKAFSVSEKAEIKRTKTTITSRTKIDSEVLLEIIHKEENYKVLSDYNGAAALVFTNLKEPNVLYCYHGESKKRDYANSPIEEERPLYFYKQGKNSLFISSMFASLCAIGAGTHTDDWGEFDTNTVYKITDGDIENAVKTKISRVTNFQTGVAMSSTSNRHGYKRNASTDNEAAGYQYDMEQAMLREQRINDAHNAAMRSSGASKKYNLFYESPVENVNVYGNKIYFNKLRYWRNGHRITGCYTWVSGYGFYFLGETVKEAETRFYNITNKMFCKDGFVNDPDTIPGKDINEAFVPFVHNSKDEYTVPLIFYFYDGIRVMTEMDYVTCEDMATRKEPFTFQQLSHCSAHPILDIDQKSKAADRQEILLAGLEVTDVICPLGAERSYEIIEGNCVDFLTLEEMSEEEDGEDTNKSLDNLSEAVRTIKEIEDKLTEIENQDNDLLEDDINDMFKEPLRKFPMYAKRLKKYQTDRGTQAFNILDEFITAATNLIAIESKE